MKPGELLSVAGTTVIRLNDVEWAVRRDSDGEWNVVAEDPDLGVFCGFLGEAWAVHAVMVAERMHDEIEMLEAA